MDFGDRSLKFTLTLDLGKFQGTILEIRLGAMDFGDLSLKFSLTLDLGDRSLKSGLGPWISGIDP